MTAAAADRVIVALGALEMSCEAARDAVRDLLQRGDYSAAVELTGLSRCALERWREERA